eukprot:Opistho-2@69478
MCNVVFHGDCVVGNFVPQVCSQGTAPHSFGGQPHLHDALLNWELTTSADDETQYDAVPNVFPERLLDACFRHCSEVASGRKFSPLHGIYMLYDRVYNQSSVPALVGGMGANVFSPSQHAQLKARLGGLLEGVKKAAQPQFTDGLVRKLVRFSDDYWVTKFSTYLDPVLEPEAVAFILQRCGVPFGQAYGAVHLRIPSEAARSAESLAQAKTSLVDLL